MPHWRTVLPRARVLSICRGEVQAQRHVLPTMQQSAASALEVAIGNGTG